MNRLDQLGAAAFASVGHGVIAANRPALLRPDARIAGAESIIVRRAAAHANKSFEPLAEVMGVPGARYGDCLHFCLQGVPAFYALAVMRFALLPDEAATPRSPPMERRPRRYTARVGCAEAPKTNKGGKGPHTMISNARRAAGNFKDKV